MSTEQQMLEQMKQMTAYVAAISKSLEYLAKETNSYKQEQHLQFVQEQQLKQETVQATRQFVKTINTAHDNFNRMHGFYE